MDEIQADLERWHHHGDQRAALRAVRRLTPQWHARVRVMARVADDRVEDIVQEMMGRLLVGRPGKPPRAMAPPEVANPAAWRAKVLRNEVASWLRMAEPREVAEDAAVHGLTADAARDLRVRRREGDEVKLEFVEPPAPDAFEALLEADEAAGDRRALLRALPQVVIKQRVAVALELGIDPSPWIPEIARATGDDEGELAVRIAEALAGRLDIVRVLAPDGGGEEAHRKARERGAAKLASLLRPEGP